LHGEVPEVLVGCAAGVLLSPAPDGMTGCDAVLEVHEVDVGAALVGPVWEFGCEDEEFEVLHVAADSREDRVGQAAKSGEVDQARESTVVEFAAPETKECFVVVVRAGEKSVVEHEPFTLDGLTRGAVDNRRDGVAGGPDADDGVIGDKYVRPAVLARR